MLTNMTDKSQKEIVSCALCGEEKTKIIAKEIYDTHTKITEGYHCFKCMVYDKKPEITKGEADDTLR